MPYLKFLLEKLSFIKDAIKKVPYKKASVLVALSAGTIFLSANVALKEIKQPKIEWDTKKLEITVFQGTSKIEGPFFISNKDLENVKLELVPELAKLVSVM
ncbi:hypothetical protein KKB41_03305 [Patescibacteria group bacterium]|nr:hypothetical protein [Patescibacteria group bacterium]